MKNGEGIGNRFMRHGHLLSSGTMHKAKVNDDGTVTVPSCILQRLRWQPGTELELTEDGHNLVVRRVPRDPESGKTFEEMTPEERRAATRRWIEKYAGTADAGYTTDEIMAMTRGDD